MERIYIILTLSLDQHVLKEMNWEKTTFLWGRFQKNIYTPPIYLLEHLCLKIVRKCRLTIPEMLENVPYNFEYRLLWFIVKFDGDSIKFLSVYLDSKMTGLNICSTWIYFEDFQE